MDEDKLEELKNHLSSNLGYSIQNNDLLVRALTHRSSKITLLKKDRDGSRFENSYNYELLEFLGDAVLDLVVAQILIEHYPGATEGTLSKLRSALVNTDSLADIALSLGLQNYVLVGKGERRPESLSRPALLADIFESLIGAYFTDRGIEIVKKISEVLFIPLLNKVEVGDPKSDLQELAHTLGLSQPTYELDGESGPEHKKEFLSIVKIGDDILGRGKGSSKKMSQMNAAREALSVINLKKVT